MIDLWAPIEAVQGLMKAGGAVMPWLGLCAAGLWYALGVRLFTLRPGARVAPMTRLRRRRLRAAGLDAAQPKDTLEVALDRALAASPEGGPLPHTVLREVFAPAHAELTEGRALVRSLVAIAPLAGLLGTVSGMIETFQSLADAALFTQGGGIAGGIGEALLTTQMGLTIAVPGIVVGRLLDRHEASLHQDLDQIADVLSSRGLSGVSA